MALHYVAHYERVYDQAREQAKQLSGLVILWIALSNVLIAVLGAAVAVWRFPWLGLISTGVAGLAAAVSALDGLYRQRDAWLMRTVVLVEVQRTKRRLEVRLAAGEEASVVALEAMDQLDAALSEDVDNWAELRRSQIAESS
ncbi:hypothetical protein [Streptomyces sp. 2A115]|uniref:hypothetical protein n=1 Tax=Streptomyces sp. 2A115 TaxID=3457439 RepID=UPI003FD1E304